MSHLPLVQSSVADGLVAAFQRVRMFKLVGLLALMALTVGLSLFACSMGAIDLSWGAIIATFGSGADATSSTVVWNLRLPRIASALFSGAALSISGLLMQTLLRNPLGSPSTIGVSQGAALGATIAIVVFGSAAFGASSDEAAPLVSGTWILVSAFAFAGGLSVSFAIWALLRFRRLPPDSLILAGVAFSSLCVSGTLFLQYFANDDQLAYSVFWSFGDVARSGWSEIIAVAIATLLALLYYGMRSSTLDILLLCDDDAMNLGIDPRRERLVGLLVAAFLASLVTSFNGIIAFVGLLTPHIAKRIVGSSHLFLLPYAAIGGAILLLISDTLARVVIVSGSLPVGVVTSLLGAPFFLYLLVGGRQHATKGQ